MEVEAEVVEDKEEEEKKEKNDSDKIHKMIQTSGVWSYKCSKATYSWMSTVFYPVLNLEQTLLHLAAEHEPGTEIPPSRASSKRP